MVTAIGIDIVDVARVERILRLYGDRFAARVLSSRERDILRFRHDRAQFVAGRFAAKEAIIKALGRYLTVRPTYAQIEIIADGSRGPVAAFDPSFAKQIEHVTALISISHEKSHAVGMAVLSEES
jgi:holo-[acyl-carrier protein] synthase